MQSYKKCNQCNQNQKIGYTLKPSKINTCNLVTNVTNYTRLKIIRENREKNSRLNHLIRLIACTPHVRVRRVCAGAHERRTI